jgi:prepilin-type N-terminal cleavage/methylation domain-containing protein
MPNPRIAPTRTLGARINSERGFTLIELLVTTVVTLVVLGGTMQVFNDALEANESILLMTDTNQNLRAGTNMMTRDLIQAGRGIPTGGIPIPSGAGVNAIRRPSPPTKSYTFPAILVLSAVTTGDALGPSSNGVATDMITLLYTDTTLALDSAPLASITSDGLRATVPNAISINAAGTAVTAGDLILFSNALGNAIQQVTRVEGQRMYFDPGDSLQLNQRTASEGTIMELKDSATTFPATTATRLIMVTYYLDTTTNPARPSLVRRINNRTGRPVAVVVENLQITYDLVDGVTNPSNVAAPAASSSNQVRKVNLFIGARSANRDSHQRTFFRNDLSTQVSLRSLSFMDRYQ